MPDIQIPNIILIAPNVLSRPSRNLKWPTLHSVVQVLPKRLEIDIPPSVTSVAEAAVGRDTIMRAVASAVLQADAVEQVRGGRLGCCSQMQWSGWGSRKGVTLPLGGRSTVGAEGVDPGQCLSRPLRGWIQGNASRALPTKPPHHHAITPSPLTHPVTLTPSALPLTQLPHLPPQALINALPLGPQTPAGGITLPEAFRVSGGGSWGDNALHSLG